MDLKQLYNLCFERELLGRYISYSHIKKLMANYALIFDVVHLGTSVLGNSISYIKLGNGSQKVLAWSQMHGNESTTTKALFDFLAFISQQDYENEAIDRFLEKYTLFVIPMLNPDGAAAYTRVNANEIDLNRDAQNLSQPESKLLKELFDEVQPDLCLNLHDQRSIFGLENGNPALISFLAPSADQERSITPARETAMRLIEKMNGTLQNHIPDCVGRYDDRFNANCVGDSFTMKGVPTILFEAGHVANDYERETTRAYIFYALVSLFDFDISTPVLHPMQYSDIPENKKNYCDVLLQNVMLDDKLDIQNIGIQFIEKLYIDKITFQPSILEMQTSLKGHRIIDCKGQFIQFDTFTELEKGLVFDEGYIYPSKRALSIKI